MFDRRKIGVCVAVCVFRVGVRVGVEEGIDMVSKDQTCFDTMKDFSQWQ